MKSNFIILFFVLFFFKSGICEEFLFETKTIEILSEKKTILASNGKAILPKMKLEISANNFEYLSEDEILNAQGNGSALLENDQIQIDFNNMKYNKKLNIIEADGTVIVYYLKEKINIKSESIFYDLEKQIISSNLDTIIEDKFLNSYKAETFLFDLKKNLIKIKKFNFQDAEQNNLNLDLAYIDLNDEIFFGKDVEIKLNNSKIDNNNEPRLKGRSVSSNQTSTKVSKGIFTNCKSRDGCPPWQLSADKIRHDKKTKTIHYESAQLKIYDIPVLYFPKFFHPDPSVKRKSGFLIPSFKSSKNSGSYLNTPYFLTIGENRDLTFNPRFYDKDQFLLQNEFRQINKDSYHTADFSLFNDSKKNLENHFFYNYQKNLEINQFDQSKINFLIQQVSNNKYLESNKLTGDLIDNESILTNSIDFELNKEDLNINLNSTIYEDLNRNNNDKYEYIFPKLDIIKNLDTNKNLQGDLILKTNFLSRQYETNILERYNYNELKFTSYPKISNYGFFNNYEFLIKNFNSDNNNTSFKNDTFNYLSGIFQYNAILPMIKESNHYNRTLAPRATFKLAPPHNKDIKNNNNKLDVANIHSINRISGNDVVEGGASITYGSNYTINDNINSRTLFDLELANNFRFEENNDLPKSNQINQKTSNLFAHLKISPSEIITAEYNTSIKNNLKEISNENLITTFKINNFITSFDYMNENSNITSNSYLTNKTTYKIDEKNSLAFATRKNKSKNITEYYNLMYQYQNDCLAASIEYNKDFYSDSDLNTDESIIFKITIMPFGQTSSPNLLQ